MTVEATQEMQAQVTGFLFSQGQLITITNTDVVE
jgi:hypothetical protein